jgi:hypothetical protein
MTRPSPILGLDPGEPVIEGARHILPVRLDELYGFAPAVADPAQEQAHHDMRIAAKRLRYTMEIFRFLFPSGFRDLTRKVRRIQDTLGLVHDYDVFVPFLSRYLEGRRLDAESELRRRMFPGGNGGRSPASIAEVRTVIERTGGADEREAILHLIERTRAHRRETFAEFQNYWQSLMEEDFRGAVLAMIGLSTFTTGPPGSRPAAAS